MPTIQGFINEISPSADDRSKISTNGETIRDTIEGKLDFIASSKLTGSYIRNIKMAPIDDLDIIFHLKGMGDTYLDRKNDYKKECRIYIKSDKYENHPLKNYVSIVNSTYYISPNKILNQIKQKIQERYTTTPEIKRNGEGVTVYLSSYDLTIDCMPYTGVSNEDYILIPTSGNDLYWKKSSPDIDKEKINELNNESNFDGKLKGVIKIMKYWNGYKNTGVSFRSYVLECIIYHSLKGKTELYTKSYTDILKITIEKLYHKKNHNILDIPGYDYIYYNLSDVQWIKIQGLLDELYDKLILSENDFISYLKS